MNETRINKYKDYRNSLIREDAVKPKDIFARNNSNSPTTSTLPLDDVMKVLDKDQKKEKVLTKEKIKYISLNISVVLVIACIIALLIILAIHLFGGN